jgi:hypothetical protein
VIGPPRFPLLDGLRPRDRLGAGFGSEVRGFIEFRQRRDDSAVLAGAKASCLVGIEGEKTEDNQTAPGTLPDGLTAVLQEGEEIVLPLQESFADNVGRRETPGGGSMLQRGTEFGLAHFHRGAKETFPVASPQLLQLLHGHLLLCLFLHLLQLKLLEDLTKSRWDTSAWASTRRHSRRIGQRNDEEDRDQHSRLPHGSILLTHSQDVSLHEAAISRSG